MKYSYIALAFFVGVLFSSIVLLTILNGKDVPLPDQTVTTGENKNDKQNSDTLPPSPSETTQSSPREVPTDTEVRAGRTIDLHGQGLTKVPSYVFEATDAEKLDLSGNALTGSLPAEVRHLKNLRILDLSDNDFTGVPAEVGQLRDLEVLDLSNNSLTGLPYELGALQHLKTLDLRGNEASRVDLEKIKETLPTTTNILLDA